jgi:hypothetical protein
VDECERVPEAAQNEDEASRLRQRAINGAWCVANAQWIDRVEVVGGRNMACLCRNSNEAATATFAKRSEGI